MMTENLLHEVERTRSRFVALHYRYQQERNELQRLTAALRTIRGSDGKHPFGWPLPAITLWRFPRNPQGTRIMLPLPPLCGGDRKALDDSFR